MTSRTPRRLLFLAAVLLMVVGVSSVCYRANGGDASDAALPTIFAEAEDFEEDHREDVFVHVVMRVGEAQAHASDAWFRSIVFDFQAAWCCHYQRGPPTVSI